MGGYEDAWAPGDRAIDDGPGTDCISFGRTYVASEAFKVLFRDGMMLVEETAAYLDGTSRDEARDAGQVATLAYAGESMRLTTRLMQIASWLLVQRAVAEGEITSGQALEERRRVKLGVVEGDSREEREGYGMLPDHLRDLVGRSRRLHARILHLDGLIDGETTTACGDDSPVAAQQGLLRSAFRR